MRKYTEEALTGDIKLAMRMAVTVKVIKIILAALLVLAYLYESSWSHEILVISVIISLVLPLGFFDVFIQKLLEYNTQKLEKRQVLNAQEANKHFEDIYAKLGK